MAIEYSSVNEETVAEAVENLRLSRDGVYYIDIDSLLKGNPVVFRMMDGAYLIGSFTGADRWDGT